MRADLTLATIPELVEELERRAQLLVLAYEFQDEHTGRDRSYTRFRVKGPSWATAGCAAALARECAKGAMRQKFPPGEDDDGRAGDV